MISKFSWFLIVIILLLSVTPALAQPNTANGYSVQHFTDENGLPQNSINDLLFDKDGYLWLASQIGLVRFDGGSFKLYYPDDKPAVESNILLLGKDDKGSLFFQTIDHHLYCYTGDNNALGHLNTPTSRRPLLLNARKQLFDFTHFLSDAGSTPETQRRERLFGDLFDRNDNFFVTRSGRVYLIDGDSLYYYDGKDLHTLPTNVDSTCQLLISGDRFYVLSGAGTIAVYDQGHKTCGSTPIEGDLAQDAQLPRNRYRLFACGKFNHLLAGNRLYRLFPQENGHVRSQFLVNLDFALNIAAVEYNAGLDLLLIATNTEGFYFLHKNRFQIDSWPVAVKEQMAQHLFGPMVLHDNREVLTDKYIFTPAGTLSPVKDSAPVWQRVLHIDRKQQVWSAIHNVPRIRAANMDPVSDLQPLDAEIVDYAEDSTGQLYCLTERSLWRQDKPGSFLRLYPPENQPIMRNNVVMAFIGRQRLWIGNDDGMVEYDPGTGHVRLIPELIGTHVRAIHCCKDGSVLIGTYGEGYYYYFQQHFFRMPLDKNGFLVTAHCFLEDRRGNVWISCNKGLFKVPVSDMNAWAKGKSSQLYYYYYGRQDGLLTNEFNGGFNQSGVITPEGFIALLSMKGMVCFFADSLGTDFPHGAINMTELEVDGKPAHRTDTIHLSAGYNSLTLKIASPYLGNRNNLYLQYNLSGLNDEWKECPEDGALNFSRLSPGNYTLRVRKVNGFGKDNYEYRQWSILIPPVIYRTTWFLSACGLLLLILLGLLIQLRLKLIEKKKEVQIQNEALLRTNRQREKLISLVIHDLRSPLRFLTMLAGDLHDNLGRLSVAELKDRTYWVKKGTRDVSQFSEDFLLWVTSQKDNFKISKQSFFIRPLLQEVYDFYLEQVLQKDNSVTFEADPHLRLYSDPHLLITIIRNLTDNANKYTEHGEIRISAIQDGRDVLIVVADNGKGMTPQQVAAFLGEDNLDNVKSGSQLGHKFIFDLTQRLDGRLSVESSEARGTVVSLRLPA